MNPRQIENLKPGPETDAEIEARFFGHSVIGRIEAQFFGHKVIGRDGRHWYVDEKPDDPEHTPRAPREFSTKTDEAMKILAACPGWRIWHEVRGITVQLTSQVVVVSPRNETRHADITGHGLDPSLPLAICKAAIYLGEMIRAFKEIEDSRAKEVDSTKDQTLEVKIEWNQGKPENQITFNPSPEEYDR